MKYFFPVLLLLSRVLTAATAQGLVISSNTGVSTNLSTAAAFNNVTAWQSIARVHNCTSGGNIYYNDDFQIFTDCNSIYYRSWRDGGGQIVGAPFPNGATDVVLKSRRDPSTQSITMEVWRTDTGAYRVGTTSLGSAFSTVPQPYFAGRYFAIGTAQQQAGGITVDYVRLFSSIDPLGTAPSPNASGNLADWELDGGLADNSTYHQTFSPNGSANFVDTPLYRPIVSFSPATNCFVSTAYTTNFCTMIASTTSSLASIAYSPNMNDALTYSWRQTGGPSSATLANTSASRTIATGLSQFGEYDFQLTVVDKEGNQTSATLAIGVVTVSASSSCLVSGVPASISYAIGPLTPWGSSKCDPWPWYDVAEAANAFQMQSQFSLPATGAAANPGTIAVSGVMPGPGLTITGNGTHFTTDCAGMPGNLAPNAPSCQGSTIAIRWNADGGTGTGWSIQQIQNVYDDTHAGLYGGYKYYPPTPYSGLQYSVIDINEYYTPFALAVNGQGGSYNWNYYDNVIAYYRLYYRTGITAFLNYARQLADAWYLYTLDHGYSNVTTPRLLGIPGLMVRALDGKPTYWNGIRQRVAGFGTSTPPPGDFDPREVGYATSYVALAAKLDPDPSYRAGYCSSTANAIQYFWAPQQLPNGGFWTDQYSINQSIPAFGQGVEPWQMAITATGFKDAYRVLQDSTVCNNPTIATQALAMAGNLLAFVYEYGSAGVRTIPAANGGGTGANGIFYMTGYTATGLTPTNGKGSVAGNAGDSSVTGSGTNFTQQFGCNGNDYIAIGAIHEMHKVTACQDDGSLQIAEPLGNSFSNSSFQVSPIDTTTNCQPSKSSVCYNGNLDDATVLPAIYGWFYSVTGNLQFKIWGDDFFSGAYGGSAGGPGTSGPPAGPGANGNTTGQYGYISALPSCSSSAPPCGGLGGPIGHHWARDFGIGSGYAGAGDNYLAYRLATSCTQCASTK